VAAAIRTIFEQPDEPAASAQLRRVADDLAGTFPAVADLLEAEPDLLVHRTFPEVHRRQTRSTHPLERLNKEIPVLDWCAPEAPRRRRLRWVPVPGPDSKEISGATSVWWRCSA
jgi:transposase-like protein